MVEVDRFNLKSFFFKKERDVVTLEIRVLDIDLLRAEIFIDDIVCLAGEDFNLITIESLMRLLYDDFLLHIRKGIDADQREIDFEEVAQSLLQLREKYYKTKRADDAAAGLKQAKWMLYPLNLQRNLVLRGEVFIHDITQVVPKLQLNIEDVVSLLFMDFISNIRKGKQREMVLALIERFNQF